MNPAENNEVRMKDRSGNALSPMRRKRRNRSVNAVDFVHMWETSKTLDEFIKYSGMNRATAISRASLYRKKGVKLQRFTSRSHVSGLDIDLLNSMTKDERGVE